MAGAEEEITRSGILHTRGIRGMTMNNYWFHTHSGTHFINNNIFFLIWNESVKIIFTPNSFYFVVFCLKIINEFFRLS
jgi:hypothetical protein